jgi:hypothetical protein
MPGPPFTARYQIRDDISNQLTDAAQGSILVWVEMRKAWELSARSDVLTAFRLPPHAMSAT